MVGPGRLIRPSGLKSGVSIAGQTIRAGAARDRHWRNLAVKLDRGCPLAEDGSGTAGGLTTCATEPGHATSPSMEDAAQMSEFVDRRDFLKTAAQGVLAAPVVASLNSLGFAQAATAPGTPPTRKHPVRSMEGGPKVTLNVRDLGRLGTAKQKTRWRCRWPSIAVPCWAAAKWWFRRVITRRARWCCAAM